MTEKENRVLPKKGTIIPLTSGENVDETIRFAQDWEKSGNTHIEILLRSDASLSVIEHLVSETKLVVAAGTVLSEEQLEAACEAGASLIITPGLSTKLVMSAHEREKTIIPGVQTPSEILTALELGLTTLKFFPATLHGPKYLEDMATIFPTVNFIPTGGINQENYMDYLNLPNVLATGGRWMFS